ncbi:MAG: acyl--CoA ligase, partial [Clostridia bacterium]|nr:acyl--CoA ligase [Clostridia bacterium]
MTIVDLLERNAREYGDETALVEINPEERETRRATWRDFELVEPTAHTPHYRREITWRVFDEKANRFANALRQRGIRKGDKVAILLMNCIEWLPVYFGILKTGALAVPLNFRYASDEIRYCLELAEVDALVFGPEFIGRVEEIADRISRGRLLIYAGPGCPSFAEDYYEMTVECPSVFTGEPLSEEDDAAIYFSSGTT